MCPFWHTLMWWVGQERLVKTWMQRENLSKFLKFSTCTLPWGKGRPPWFIPHLHTTINLKRRVVKECKKLFSFSLSHKLNVSICRTPRTFTCTKYTGNNTNHSSRRPLYSRPPNVANLSGWDTGRLQHNAKFWIVFTSSSTSTSAVTPFFDFSLDNSHSLVNGFLIT